MENDDERDEWPSRRRRGSPFEPWGFPDIDEMMRQMERAFSEQFKEIGPIVYGYSVTIGLDGKPIVREFGNVRPGPGTPVGQIQEKREPLVDVVSSDKEVRVIAEMPGVKKEDINLTVNAKSLTISVEREDRPYYKELSLPGVVDPKGAKSSYNNGVLEVTIPLKSPGGGVKLRID